MYASTEAYCNGHAGIHPYASVNYPNFCLSAPEAEAPVKDPASSATMGRDRLPATDGRAAGSTSIEVVCKVEELSVREPSAA